MKQDDTSNAQAQCDAWLSPEEEKYYTDLDEKATRGELKFTGPVNHDPEAGAKLIMWATGTDNVEDAQRVALGRPPLGREHHPSPTVRFKAPARLKDAMAAQAKRLGMNVSELWREVGERYLASVTAQ